MVGSRQSQTKPAYLIRAASEQSPLPELDSESRKRREAAMEGLLFVAKPAMRCFVVEVAGELEGFATFGKQYSTWKARRYLYLDCLFLTAGVRGLGIGRTIMERVRDEARASGLDEVQWQTPGFNSGAIKFYERLGASPKAKQRFFWKV